MKLTTPENTITYRNALCLSPQNFWNFAKALFSVSLGAILTPKRNWRKCSCKILGWQTKSIMICYGIFWSGQLWVSLCIFKFSWQVCQVLLNFNTLFVVKHLSISRAWKSKLKHKTAQISNFYTCQAHDHDAWRHTFRCFFLLLLIINKIRFDFSCTFVFISPVDVTACLIKACSQTHYFFFKGHRASV